MDTMKRYPATWAIIVVNVLVFFAVDLTGGSENVEHMIKCGASYGPYIQDQGEYYRLFTCMFLHFGLKHLGNNMLILYFVGGYLERAAGTVKYLIIYLLGGMGASYLSYYVDLQDQSFSVSAGASGAVFASVGAMIWVLLINKGKLEDLTAKQMIFMAALSLYFGFTSTGVDNVAHLGGLVAGFLLTALIYRKSDSRMTS